MYKANGQCNQRLTGFTCEPLCRLRVWHLVSEIRLSAGSNPCTVLRHKAVPCVGQVEASIPPASAKVGRPAKILFLTIAALYLARALSLGMLLSLLEKSGLVRP